MDDLISIIMPSYNTERYVSEAIQSVYTQTHSNWELIVVDDCSRDKTRLHIESWQRKDNRIVPVYLSSNRGVVEARNIAIDAAKGRYIALLDSDDLWCSDKLATQIKFMRDKHCLISFTAYRYIDERGKILPFIAEAVEDVRYRQLLQQSHIGCLTVMYDVKALGKVHMPNYFHEDYAAWLSVLRRGHHAKGINEVLAYYRLRKDSRNRNKLKAAWHRWEIYRRAEKMGLKDALVSMTYYAVNGVLRPYLKQSV